MSSFTMRTRLCAAGILAGLAAAMPAALAVAQQNAAPPDFSSNQVGWVGVGGGGPGFAAVPGRLPPVGNDPAHPFVPNNTRAQPTFRIADLSNPNLKPWVKGADAQGQRRSAGRQDRLRRARAASRRAFPPSWLSVEQTRLLRANPKQVWLIYSGDQQVRASISTCPISAHPKSSWYGRVGRTLRRQHARGRHHRAKRQDGERRSLLHAHREAARRGALDHDRRRPGDGGELHGGGPGHFL